MALHGLTGQDAQSAPRSVDTSEIVLTRWQKFRLIVKVVELRLRFIAIMAATGLVFAYWDTLSNRFDKWMRPDGAATAIASSLEYYCPMHPQVVQSQPGTCPICGMPLAKRKKGEKATLPPGVTARVELAPFRVNQAGIKTTAVEYVPLKQTLTTVGYVAFDERRIANIISKVPGKSRVEKLFVNFTGQDVKAGEALAELYSPELAQAIQELLSAGRRAEGSRPQSAAVRSVLGDRQELLRATAEKLKRWGITQSQIDEILKSGKADFTLPILSPISGHVFKKNVVEGQEVQEGHAMFEVADLQSVWVQAQVYEHQIGLVREGQTVEASVEAFPGETFSGKVEFIQPHLDPVTRTVEVRYALENPGHRLRPGMFARVTLQAPVADSVAVEAVAEAAAQQPHAHHASLTVAEQKTCPVTRAKLGSMGEPIAVEVDGRKVWTCCAECPPKIKADPAKYLSQPAVPPSGQVLVVPEMAVIDTGNRKVVYVERGPGVFEGREVVLGPRVGDYFPVLEGLVSGEKVAAAGAFLVDAESRVNPGARPAETEAKTAGAPMESHDHSGAATTHRHSTPMRDMEARP
jgi:Cu(I)/Ag(I) efflux system membrane fusion protein